MYEMRMPSITVSSTMQSAVSKNRLEYTRKMLQVSTGQKYVSRSEDPVDTQEMASLQIKGAQSARWVKNLDYASSWAQTTDATVQRVIDVMQRVNELIVQANSGINDSTSRSNIATELNSIIGTLVQLGNTKYDGESVFSGTATCADPFVATYDADDNVTSVAFLGVTDPLLSANTESRKIAVSDSSTASYDILGEGVNSLFKFVYDNKDGTSSEVRLFDELIKLREQLQNTSETPDDVVCAKIQAGLDNVIERSVDSGAMQTKFKTLKSTLSAVSEQTANRLSELGSVDEATAISELYLVQSALQASLQMINKINDMSIVNYIN